MGSSLPDLGLMRRGGTVRRTSVVDLQRSLCGSSAPVWGRLWRPPLVWPYIAPIDRPTQPGDGDVTLDACDVIGAAQLTQRRRSAARFRTSIRAEACERTEQAPPAIPACVCFSACNACSNDVLLFRPCFADLSLINVWRRAYNGRERE